MPEKVPAETSAKKPNPFRAFIKRLFLPISHTIFFTAVLLSVLFTVLLFIPFIIETINTWHLSIQIILSVFYSLGLILVLYFAIMKLYIFWKQKKSHLKFLPEVVIMVGAFVLSVGFKFYAYCRNPEFGVFNLSDVMQAMGLSLYAAIGGLQFEGVPYTTGGSCFAVAMYYGSSILAGLIFFSVIASQAFYEIYCRVLLLFMDTSGKDIYVFTALNDETLNIAKSISEDEKIGDRSVVIFAGPSLKPFDRHDPNCVEAMGHRYLFWSFSARRKKDSAPTSGDRFLARIGLFSFLRRPTNWNEVHVFAFDSDDDHIPNEEENMDYVFMDARNQLALMQKKAQKGKVAFTQINRDGSKQRLVLSRHEACDYYYGNLEAINHENWLLAGMSLGENKKPHQDEIERLEKNNDSMKEAFARAYRSARNEAKEAKVDKKYGVPRWHISYYILTKRKINYQAYQDKIEELDAEFINAYRFINCNCFAAYNEMQEIRGEFNKKKADYEKTRHKFLNSGDDTPTKPDELLQELDESKKNKFRAEKKFAHTWQKRKPFSIYVWNESDAIAREAHLAMIEDDKMSIIPDTHDTWVRAYGFGPTGQSLARMLFTYTVAFDRKTKKSADFFCEVLDPDGASKLAGLTRLEMPFSAVFADDGNGHKDLENEYRQRRATIIQEAYKGFLKVKDEPTESDPTIWDMADELVPTLFDGSWNNEKLTEELADRHETLLNPNSIENWEIPVPCFYFHDYGIGDVRSLEVSREEQPNFVAFRSPFAPQKNYPDYILVAVGDDYANIRVANDVIKTLVSSPNADKKVTVFVNVWDEKNNNLILGFAKARKKAEEKGKKKRSEISSDAGQVIYYSKNIRLIIIGNNADIYQQESVLPDVHSCKSNFAYDAITEAALEDASRDDLHKKFSRISNEYFRKLGKYMKHAINENPTPDDFVTDFAPIWEAAKSHTKEFALAHSDDAFALDALIAWRSLDIWRRRSSTEAQLSGARYYAELKAWEPESGEKMEMLLCDLARLEHQRWMRLHIADGWSYGLEKNARLQRHNSILPYSLMRWETGVFDLMNVYLGIAIGCRNENRLPAENDADLVFGPAANDALCDCGNDAHRILCSRFDASVWDFVQSAKNLQRKKLEIRISSATPCADRNVTAFVLSLPLLSEEQGSFGARNSTKLGDPVFEISFQNIGPSEVDYGPYVHYSVGKSAEEEIQDKIDEGWQKSLAEYPVFVLSSESRLKSSYLLRLGCKLRKTHKLETIILLSHDAECRNYALDQGVLVHPIPKD